MTALGKLFRTTAFKLTLVYLTTFVLFAAIVLVYFAWNTRRLINEQITQTVDSETVTLQDEYDIGGIRRLILTLDARARRPDSYLYMVTPRAGAGVAGDRRHPWDRGRAVCDAARAAARRCHDRDRPDHHGGRPVRAPSHRRD